MASLKLSQITPAAPANANDQIVGVKSGAIDALYSIAQIIASAPNIIASPGTFSLPATTLGDVLVNVNAAVTVQLPAASARANAPVVVADIGGFAAAHNITILPFGTETIMGLASLAIATPYGSFSLAPIPGGGWYQR